MPTFLTTLDLYFLASQFITFSWDTNGIVYVDGEPITLEYRYGDNGDGTYKITIKQTKMWIVSQGQAFIIAG